MKKTIAIIGAGTGVGMAIAERFGKEGYNVALIARTEEKLTVLVNQLATQGITSAYFQADILERNALSDALLAAKKHFGTIDVLEFSPQPPMSSIRTPMNSNVDDMQFQIEFQLLSAVAAVQAVLPGMLENKSGSLLFTTASSAQKPLVLTGSFGIAAGALLNYARSLNKELAPENIFAGIVSIAGMVYSGDEPDPQFVSQFPKGMPFVAAKDVAEAHWQLHTSQNKCEVIVGDFEAAYAVPEFY